MLMSDLSPRKDRRAAILQSCYIPWKGYFDIIAMVDVFVVYDEMLSTARITGITAT